jgi:hypothetical protein
VFGVENELSVVHFPLGQLSFHASFVLFFYLFVFNCVLGGGGGVKAKSSQ